MMTADNGPAQATLQPPETGVTVRMYDLQGEGDCFLLAFRATDDSPRYMLIDCGIFLGTSGGADRMRAVAGDVARSTGNHIDVVVITHEHWDHIVGFEYAKKTFFGDQMSVDEVWMAWTENVDGDDLARRLHEAYELAGVALAASVSKLESEGDARAARIRDVLAYRWDIEGALGFAKKTDAIMDKLSAELSGRLPTYFIPGGSPVCMPGVTGLRFFALGPPRDEDLLKIMDGAFSLNSGTATIDEATAFLSAAVTSFGGEALEAAETDRYVSMRGLSRPFSHPYGMNGDEARAYKADGEPFFANRYGFSADDAGPEWRRIDTDWLGAADRLALQTDRLALQMDDFTNNTSLVLAIEIGPGGQVLLFPGDAQVGNWGSWEDVTWTAPALDSGEDTVNGMDLVRRTVLYKVGHHGSHNGTLVAHLNQMSDELVAMIPVNEEWAREKKGWEHPGCELLSQIEAKARGRVIRADTRLPENKPAVLSWGEWEAFQSSVEEDQGEDKLWIQYTVSG